MNPVNLDEARAVLARRYPNIAPDDDPTCADCFTSVHVRDGCEWTNGEDVCDACASSRLGRTEAGLRAALAEVDRLRTRWETGLVPEGVQSRPPGNMAHHQETP